MASYTMGFFDLFLLTVVWITVTVAGLGLLGLAARRSPVRSAAKEARDSGS